MTRSRITLIWICVLFSNFIYAQTFTKPIGCFAGTNGINAEVLSHEESGGSLLIAHWGDIEPSPGVFDFTALQEKIDLITSSGKKYALAVGAGTFGSPEWLLNDPDIPTISFNYQNNDFILPFWWDEYVLQRMDLMINRIGEEFSEDESLSHIYITQMTTNGVEGHLNGVDMNTYKQLGFTNDKWIEAAQHTTATFVDAFPNHPLVFEIHEIDRDTIVPALLMDYFYNNPAYCQRLGLGMWWISGKTSYQTNLIEYIREFEGDKYAQVIGRSDQPQRFQDSMYSTVFAQAKELGFRYIEPWPYEFQHHTHDELFEDFNAWAEANFTSLDSCQSISYSEEIYTREVNIFPNPAINSIQIKHDSTLDLKEATIISIDGIHYYRNTCLNSQIVISSYPSGIYFIELEFSDGSKAIKKFVKSNY